jgi:hypothetical protein
MNKSEHNEERVNYIIQHLNEMDVDGEKMEYILNQVGMEEQILRQLVMKSKEEDILALLEEKKSIPTTSSRKWIRKFECIKGIADKENTNVVCVKGDIVMLESTDEGEVLVIGIYGYSEGYEISLTPSQFVESFQFQEMVQLN